MKRMDPMSFPKKSMNRIRKSLKLFSFVGITSFAGYSGYEISRQHFLPPQLDFDSSKKTLVVLGSGWGSTSFLNSLDTESFNVIVISPRNYFLFTPLLPSATVGTVDLRSIMQPIRYITRHKKRRVVFLEGECTYIDTKNQTVSITHTRSPSDQLTLPSPNESSSSTCPNLSTIRYDYLVVGVGAENATFNIPGVKKHASFLKESWDAAKLRSKLMDCIEQAGFPHHSETEIERVLHVVVVVVHVGGGPTGVEFAAELEDFLREDLSLWYPELRSKIKVTLVEATNNILPMFSKSLIEYAEKHLIESRVQLLKNTVVKGVDDAFITVAKNGKDKELEKIPYGLLVWATGLAPRPLVMKLIKDLGHESSRGLLVDNYLQVQKCSQVFALGDTTHTKYAPTAQVASSQGHFLAQLFNEMGKNEPTKDSTADFDKVKEKWFQGFRYDHLGTLAYIGRNSAIADHLPGGVKSSGWGTNFFWKSAYLSKLFSFRNRVLVSFDWAKKSVFGRDISRE